MPNCAPRFMNNYFSSDIHRRHGCSKEYEYRYAKESGNRKGSGEVNNYSNERKGYSHTSGTTSYSTNCTTWSIFGVDR